VAKLNEWSSSNYKDGIEQTYVLMKRLGAGTVRRRTGNIRGEE
jgi:hypothetical protein